MGRTEAPAHGESRRSQLLPVPMATAPALDPTCERVGVRFPRATRPLIVCASQRDAQRVMAVLPKRFGKYGLTLHPHKTRVIRFTRPPRRQGGWRREGEAWLGTVDWLGFTHYWGRSQRGNWVVKRKLESTTPMG